MPPADEILSRINGTTPNQLTFESSFWGPIVSYIGLPILAVLAAMMPAVGRTRFGWTATVGQMFSGGGNCRCGSGLIRCQLPIDRGRAAPGDRRVCGLSALTLANCR